MNNLNKQLLEQWTSAGYSISDFMDEYHSFNDLYTQRMYLTALAFNSNPSIAWKSKEHSDDSMFEGYFIVGIDTPEGQYTYHYKLEYWDLFKVEELDRAPEWDGHTSADVTRLMSIKLKSEVYTFSSYSLDKHHPLLWHLYDGIQEEHMLDMSEVIEELKEHPEYMEEFFKEVDTTADNFLLLKGW